MDQTLLYIMVAASGAVIGAVLMVWANYVRNNAKARLLKIATKALQELATMQVNQHEAAQAMAREAAEAAQLTALKAQVAALS